MSHWPVSKGYALEFECLRALFRSHRLLFPFRGETPSGSVNPNIKMAYEYTCSLTGIALFSRIPLGVQKTLLHGGGVTSCGTYSHQSGPQAIPPTASSADPAGGSGLDGCFLLMQNSLFGCFLHISSERRLDIFLIVLQFYAQKPCLCLSVAVSVEHFIFTVKLWANMLFAWCPVS